MIGRLLKRLVGPTKSGPDSYTLVLRFSDGLCEYQSYDTEEEACLAGETAGGDVESFDVRPWFCEEAIARLKANG